MKMGILAILGQLLAMGVILFYAPEEAEQGPVQKIFYIHVGCALTMYLGFFVAFLSSLFYLADRKLRWDEISFSAVEVGFYLCTVVLITGPIWAKPAWGAWWTWEPRLTTTLLLWLLYASYLVVRSYFADSPRAPLISAVMAIVAFLDVPLIHFSVRLWRGIHPSVIGAKGGGMDPAMLNTLILTTFTTVLLFAALFAMRLRLEQSRNRTKALKLSLQEMS